MTDSKINEILKIYKQLAENPNLVFTKIISSGENVITIRSFWSQRDLERHEKLRFVKDFTYDESLNLISESLPVDVTSQVLTTYTNDGTLTAIMRNVKTESNVKTKQFIEIWNKYRLLKSYDLSAFDVHGEVYSDSDFSSFHWSFDNTQLLYVAEKKLPKHKPFYSGKANTNIEKIQDKEISRGTEYIFRPDWGEQLIGKHRSVIVILNIVNDTINVVSSIPIDYFPAQVVWVPNSYEIVGTAFKLHTRYLGKIFCTNRESYIFHLKGEDFRKISLEGLSCASPQFSPDGKYLIWLERNISPAHHHVQRLMKLEWHNSQNPTILIDVVDKYKIIKNGVKFYGLYNQSLPEQCWSDDSKYIFLSTPQRFNIKSYIINVETKEITEIKNDLKNSMSILNTTQNYIALSRTSLIEVPQLLLTKFDPAKLEIGDLFLIECTKPLNLLNESAFMYNNTEYEYDNSESVRNFNFAYLGKKDNTKKSMPLVAIIHGGPHSTFSNIFTLDHAVFAALGFGVLRINYRGSIGFGGESIEYLLGKVGECDVFDCMTAINAALDKYDWLDPEKITVVGGSHGGFLSAHISAKYPEFFKAVIMRNPVIDLAANFSITDIPDWCPGETGVSTLGTLPEKVLKSDYPQLLRKLLDHSPILYADKVKAPTLIGLGLRDLRVPSSQGKLWYYRLNENNIETKLFMYDDNHSLLKDEVEMDFIINSALWLMKYTNGL